MKNMFVIRALVEDSWSIREAEGADVLEHLLQVLNPMLEGDYVF